MKVGGWRSKVSPRQKHETLSETITKVKSAGVVAEVLEHLPSKHEALSSNASTAKKENYTEILLLFRYGKTIHQEMTANGRIVCGLGIQFSGRPFA
jgi:hypothetical protein